MSTKVLESGKPWSQAQSEQQKVSRAAQKMLSEKFVTPDKASAIAGQKAPQTDPTTAARKAAIKKCLYK